nr:MAG TPA: hypothetical protein [Caudoviricetes sp.]
MISCCFCELPEMEIPLSLRCRIKASGDLQSVCSF